MRKKCLLKKKIAVILFFFGLVGNLFRKFPAESVLAAAHTCTAACFCEDDAAIHYHSGDTTNGGACYSDASYTYYCTGTWEAVGNIDYVASRNGNVTWTDYYYGCNVCGYLQEQKQVVLSSVKTYINWFDKPVSGFSASSTIQCYPEWSQHQKEIVADYGLDGKAYCPNCSEDRKKKGFTTFSEKYTSEYSKDELVANVVIYQCSKCKKTIALYGSFDGITHGDRNVTAYTLSCGKTEGLWYDGAGNLCVCHAAEAVTNMTVSVTSPGLTGSGTLSDPYIISAGVPLSVSARISLLDGTSLTVSPEVSGFDSRAYNVLQTVQVSAPAGYPYSIQGQNGHAVAKRYSTSINVYIQGSFNLTADVSGQGDVLLNGRDLSSLDVLGGESIQISPKANEGSHLEALFFNDTCLFVNLGGVADPTVPQNTYTVAMPSFDSEIRAVFAGNICSVSFNAWGGIVSTDSLKVPYGKSLGSQKQFPASAEKEGYIFLGWFTESGGGTIIDASTIVRGDAIYYAHWAPTSDELLQVGFDEKYPHLVPMSIEGFSPDESFWRKDIMHGNGAGEALGLNEYVRNLGDSVVYGRWIPNKYTITILADGGTFSQTETEGLGDASEDGKMEYVSGNEVRKEIYYHTALGDLPVPMDTDRSFSRYVLADGGAFSTLSSNVYSFPRDITIKAEWLSHSLVPDDDAFKMTGFSVKENFGNYDITKGIPSTEELCVSGDVSPFYVSWVASTNSKGKVKIASSYIYAIRNMVFSMRDAVGNEGLGENKVEFYLDVSENYFSDRIEYTTSNNEISIIIYYSSDTDDEILVNGSGISLLASSRYSSPSTEHFERVIPIKAETLNGEYQMYYSYEYDLIN